MTGWITSVLAGAAALLATGVLAQPVSVGAVVSRTGAHADVALGYRRALELWRDEVNAAGGLLGRRVALRLRDDASEAVRAGREYEKLVEEGVDLLVGPYGSAATMMGAAVAERARRVMVNGAGPARIVHRRAPQYVFQSAVPYAAYGAGVLEVAEREGRKTLYLLARDDPRARDMAEAAAELARARGLPRQAVHVYAPGNTDFGAQVAEARAAGAEAWIAFGEAREAVDMVRTFKALGYAPQLFFARASHERAFVTLLGQYAEFSLGALEWDAGLRTPGNAAFVEAYAAKWSRRPDAAAAFGYAAGTVLAAAVREAGSLDQEKLRQALGALEVPTVLGTYKVDPANGAQVGLQPVLTQVLGGRPAVVWPEALKMADAALPYPQWADRTYLK